MSHESRLIETADRAIQSRIELIPVIQMPKSLKKYVFSCATVISVILIIKVVTLFTGTSFFKESAGEGVHVLEILTWLSVLAAFISIYIFTNRVANSVLQYAEDVRNYVEYSESERDRIEDELSELKADVYLEKGVRQIQTRKIPPAINKLEKMEKKLDFEANEKFIIAVRNEIRAINKRDAERAIENYESDEFIERTNERLGTKKAPPKNSPVTDSKDASKKDSK